MQSVELEALWKLISQFWYMWGIHAYSYVVSVTEVVFPLFIFSAL